MPFGTAVYADPIIEIKENGRVIFDKLEVSGEKEHIDVSAFLNIIDGNAMIPTFVLNRLSDKDSEIQLSETNETVNIWEICDCPCHTVGYEQITYQRGNEDRTISRKTTPDD